MNRRRPLSTLPIGTAVVRLADEHPEPFLVRVPRCPVREGAVSDQEIRQAMASHSGDSAGNSQPYPTSRAIPPVPRQDRKKSNIDENTRPPSPNDAKVPADDTVALAHPDPPTLSSEAIRFLADVAARPLSTTVSRYQRLKLSRRKGNAIRQQLAAAGIIEPVAIATRAGQVVLYRVSDSGLSVCKSIGIEPGPSRRPSLEHEFWAAAAARHFEGRGYDVTREYAVAGNGAIDLLVTRPGERVAVEIETGKSDIKGNISKLRRADFDRVVLIATSPAAATTCQRIVHELTPGEPPEVELMTWLDLSAT